LAEREPVSDARFEELAEEALDALPDWILTRLDNVSDLIEPTPPPEQPNLAGLYEGVPLTRRDSGYQMVLPDRITLFRSVLLNGAHTEKDVRERVRHTVIHEVAHFFGLSDDQLREMGRY
jgi:predicted Zn-dependent protease with MMP-like domain